MTNGLIDLEESEKVRFDCAFSSWFKAKCNATKPATVDRIEVTFNRYYRHDPFIEKCISNISEKDIVDFITKIITKEGEISKRDFDRILQIVRGVLNYCKDLGYSGARLYDWDSIKRNIPVDKINTETKVELAPSKAVVNHIIKCVVIDNVYQLKRSACLLLCMNFYLGLRIGELSALKFTDFDMEKRILKITQGDSKHYERDEEGNRTRLVYETGDPKNKNAVRTIPLLPEVVYLYKLIVSHHEVCNYNSGYLCYDGADVIRVRSLDRALRRLCKLCSTKQYNSHLIRKTFATVLHHANVPTRAIADLMGHSDIRTTEKNYILSFEDSQDLYYDYMKAGLVYN